MSESAEDIIQKVDEKAKEFKPIFDRMDFDYDFSNLRGRGSQVDFSIGATAFRGERENEVLYISPRPKSLSDHITSRLSRAAMQIIIRLLEEKGEDKRDDISALERLQVFGFEAADQALVDNPDIGMPLRDFLIWCGAIRGRMAARILVWEDDGKTIFDYVPLSSHR